MVNRFDAVLCDLLMAVMNSLEAWILAAGGREEGIEWRDAVTARMAAMTAYVPYERLVSSAAAELGLPPKATPTLFDRWRSMEPWPDAAILDRLEVPYGFVTNCSSRLAVVAAERSRRRPAFTLSAEEAGWYKPDARIYREACRRLGSVPERTLFVAGSPYDAEGARAADLPARLVVRRQDQPPPRGAIPTAASVEETLAGLLGDGAARS